MRREVSRRAGYREAAVIEEPARYAWRCRQRARRAVAAIRRAARRSLLVERACNMKIVTNKELAVTVVSRYRHNVRQRYANKIVHPPLW